MAPLLFTLGLQEPLEKLASEFPDAHVLVYLDDVYLQGPAPDVEREHSFAFLSFARVLDWRWLRRCVKCGLLATLASAVRWAWYSSHV